MKRQRTVSAAIIGTGEVAGGYDTKKADGDLGVYSHAGAFRRSGKIQLKAVYDTNTRKAAAFARTWRTKEARSIQQIIQERYDLISVCTPDQTHYNIARNLLRLKACKTLCLEKPAAASARQIKDLMRLAQRNRICVAVNFQRHFDPVHLELASMLRRAPANILAVQGLYIKGLDHNGVTMVDTLRLLFGDPRAVQALRRVFNRDVGEYSYDFVLFYPHFAVTVRTADSDRMRYAYHIFEIDILLKDQRLTFINNSWSLRESRLGRWGSSGVKKLKDEKPSIRPTGFPAAMKGFAHYLYRITTGRQKHSQNTLESSYINARIIEAIKQSYRRGLKKVAHTRIK